MSAAEAPGPALADLLRRGLEAYLSAREDDGLEPAEGYLSYDVTPIDQVQWRQPGATLVKDELCELTNLLHGWHQSLRRWHAWNRALLDVPSAEAWEWRMEFVEARVHQCLLQPSALRDALTFVATNAVHQMRLVLEKEYRDRLDGDPVPGKPVRFLTRRQKETRLKTLLAPWPVADAFLAELQSLDDVAYRATTFDYRNRTSHAIGPRLAVGLTGTVVRSVVPATTMQTQPDGTFAEVPLPGKQSVRYAIGGTPPLDLEQARLANLDQYRRARACFERFREHLFAATAAMPPATSLGSVAHPSG